MCEGCHTSTWSTTFCTISKLSSSSFFCCWAVKAEVLEGVEDVELEGREVEGREVEGREVGGMEVGGMGRKPMCLSVWLRKTSLSFI